MQQKARQLRWFAARVAGRWMVLVVTLGVATVCAQQPQKTDVTPIVRALQAHNAKEALRLSTAALAKTPADFRLWTLKGMAVAEAGTPQAALECYQHALRLAPDYLPALEGAAQTEFQMGRPGARALLEKILVRRPGDAATHVLLGVLDAREKKCEMAVDQFTQGSAALAQQPEAQTENAICLAELHRNNEAVEAFAALVAAEPSSPAARYNLALAQWNTRRAKEALDTLEPLVKGATPDSDALTLAAEIAESQGDTVRAVALLRRALEIDPKHMGTYLAFATLSYDHASPQTGVDMMDFGLKQMPKEARLYLVRGVLLAQLGEFARAADDFAAASRLNPRLLFLGVAEGLVESQQHHSAEALAQFRDAVKAHPNEAMAHYLLAEALDSEDKLPENAESREKVAEATAAVRLDPGFVAARDLLASIDLENGRTGEAIEQSRKALELDAGDQQAVYHLVVALRKNDSKHEIPGLLKKLMELRATPNEQREHAKPYRLYVEHTAER